MIQSTLSNLTTQAKTLGAAQTVGNTANDPDVSQSQHDDPEVTNDTGYTQEINTGRLQNPDLNNQIQSREVYQLPTSHQETLTSINGNPGFEKTTQGSQHSGGINRNNLDVIPHAPVLDEFLKKQHRGRPPASRG